ncbi:S8 family serine peptidase [Kribbella sp. NBC_00359]|uniref:S8 family serine peptidase n=1 Tax=Kribbella sp. NBC_00359 TaxID=2975966 RepID=UPI002E1A68A5
MPGFLVSRISATAATVALSASAVVLATLGPASASPAPSLHPVFLGKISGAAIPGKYFVKLKDNPSVRKHGVAARSQSLASGHSGKLVRVLEGAVQGFSANLSPEQAQKLAAEPDVEYVQQERTYQLQTTQVPTPSWGLDRLDQRRGVNLTYNYIGSAGAGVHAYIVDSGIRADHPDLKGRVELGFNAVNGTTDTDDCFGHGTYSAGIVGGTLYGVAKKVSLVPVKMSGCSGFIDDDDPIIAGINWVIGHAVKPAVINLSLGSTCKDPVTGEPAPCSGGEQQGIVDAEKAAIAAGITVVTAAGNSNANACFNPVGSAAGTINVGATDVTDHLWNDGPDFGSNWGGCVDIFAPGVNILSIGGVGHILHPTDPNQIDPDPMPGTGTSAAVPHVVGAVALLLGTPKFATATPAQIAAELDAQSTRGIIRDLPDELSPNKLLFLRPTSPRTGSTVALARNDNGKLSIFGTNADNSTTSTDLGGHMFTGTQADTPNEAWPTHWTQSVSQGYASVTARSDGGNKIELVGLTAAQDEIFHRQQAVLNSPSWLTPSQLDGSLTSVALAPNADGRLMLIGADTHGGLHYRNQGIAGNDTSWQPSKTISFLGDAQNVTAAIDSLGRINIFIADTHGAVWYARQTAANTDTWATITPLADTDHKLLNEITVTRDSNNKLELFGTEGDGDVWVRVENTPGSDGNFSSWTQLSPKALFHLSAALNLHNLLVVVGVDNHGDTWQTTQNPGANTYTGWTKIEGLTLRP